MIHLLIILMPIWHLSRFPGEIHYKNGCLPFKNTNSWVKRILLKFWKKQMAAELFKDLSHKSSCLQLMDITNLLLFWSEFCAQLKCRDEDCSVSGQIKQMKTELLENVRIILKRKTELHFSYRNCGRTLRDWQHWKIL